MVHSTEPSRPNGSHQTCENCAIELDTRIEPLVAVCRIYPAHDDQPERRLDVTEWWCVSCATQYPNELVEPQPER